MARRRTKAEIEAEKFDKVVRGTKLIPTRFVPMACIICGEWLNAKIVGQSSTSVTSVEEGEPPGVLFELALFAAHDCLEND